MRGPDVTRGHVVDHQLANRGRHPSQGATAPLDDTLAHDDHDADSSNGDDHGPSPSQAVKKPTQLQFYEGPWHDTLKCAKLYYQLFIHCECDNPFPERTSFSLEKAHSYLIEAVDHLEDDERQLLDDGAPFLSHFFCTLIAR
jgi:hypothetical protein